MSARSALAVRPAIGHGEALDRRGEHRLAVALAFNGTPKADAHERWIREVIEAVYLDLGLADAGRR